MWNPDTRGEGEHLVVIGVDAHKRTHTVAVVDEIGRTLGERTVQATMDGHLDVVRWARPWERVSFAVEDCRHLTRRLEQTCCGPGSR